MAEANGYDSSLEIANLYMHLLETPVCVDVEGSGESEYPKYPIEMLWEASGDCEDAAIFYISLIEAINYDAMIVTDLSKSPVMKTGVVMLGLLFMYRERTVWEPIGMVKKINLNPFYFVETTAYYVEHRI